jgi:hypothetical protein
LAHACEACRQAYKVFFRHALSTQLPDHERERRSIKESIMSTSVVDNGKIEELDVIVVGAGFAGL